MSGPPCCSNPPTLNPSGGAGHVDKVGGVDSYLTGSPHSKLAVLMVSDVFGYEVPNLRKLADKVAAAGYYVVVPDLLDGEPFNPQNSNRPLPVWLKYHGPDKGSEAAKPIIEALKSKGVSAIASVCFCWGAKVVVELAKSKLIQTAVLMHPSFISLDDIRGFERLRLKLLIARRMNYLNPFLPLEFTAFGLPSHIASATNPASLESHLTS
ncbi:Endo-1,3/1,4-beta-D-glucanase protein [Spatholobus suberectus]|nr:Endo-1,3/1,4-beta-D-glucanase protein [Spatholobus suberectus]